MANMPDFFSDIGGGVQSLGAGIGSFMSASGYDAEAGSYEKAATLAGEEATNAPYQAALKASLEQKQAYGVIGRQQAQIGGGNLAGGDQFSLLQSSLQQSYLNTAMITQQGAINQQAYENQEAAANAQAKMASEQASGAIFGGIMDMGESAFKFAAAGASL